MRTITLDEFLSELKAQGVPQEHFAFRCPMCGTIQSAVDLIAAGAGADFDAVEKHLGFSCVGRWTGAGTPKDTIDGRGCNWTLGGLLQTHKLEVVTPDGKCHPRFEPCTPAQAKAHACLPPLDPRPSIPDSTEAETCLESSGSPA
ncbi:MAG: hypothetical protein KY476_00500 [Planctomycetes bacterium]|nr:hypothetical protein [Planctomycetota bacterium]